MTHTVEKPRISSVRKTSAFISYANGSRPEALIVYPPHNRVPHVHLAEMGFDEYIQKYNTEFELVDLIHYLFGSVNCDNTSDNEIKRIIDWEYFNDPQYKDEIGRYLQGGEVSKRFSNTIRLMASLIPKGYAHYVLVMSYPKQTSVALCLGKYLKDQYPSAQVILSRTIRNSFLSLPPITQDLIQYPFIDICANSFEQNIHQIVTHKPVDLIEDIYYRKNGEVVFNEAKNGFIRLPDLPPPKYEHLKGKKVNVLYYELGRGCVEKCSFCTHGDQLLTFNSFKRVVGDLKYLTETFACKDIMLLNTAINFSKAYILKLCEEIHTSGLDINWSSYIFINLIDDEIAAAMKRSGCYSVNLAIEAPVKNELNEMKLKDFDAVTEKLKILKKNGIKILASFILGSINSDDREESAVTEFLLKHDGLIDVAAINMFEMHALNVDNYAGYEGVSINRDFSLDKRYFEFTDKRFSCYRERVKAIRQVQANIFNRISRDTSIRVMHWDKSLYENKNKSFMGPLYLNYFCDDVDPEENRL